jgi:hypothetical protein
MRREMALTFNEQLTITVIDKGVIGVLVLVAGLWFNSMLEEFKTAQVKAIEELKNDLTRKLEIAPSDVRSLPNLQRRSPLVTKRWNGSPSGLLTARSRFLRSKTLICTTTI